MINLVQFKDDEIAVEIGSERGEGSTAYLSDYLKDKAPFFSVDIIKRTDQTIVCEGAKWLSMNKKPIKFCYLDNFDYIFKNIENAPWLDEQKKEYADLGLEETNENSEIAHLQQAIFLHEQSADNCVVVVDDTWVEDGKFNGKGAKAVPYLMDKGWGLINEVGNDYKSFVALRKVNK